MRLLNVSTGCNDGTAFFVCLFVCLLVSLFLDVNCFPSCLVQG